MRLNPLVGLVWVARHQSYAKAVRSFPYPITQPGLHHQVRSLEEELGVTLFTRVAKDRVVATPAAAELISIAEPFIESLQGALARLESRVASRLRIQSSGLVLRGVVAPMASRLRKLAPELELRVDEIRRPTAETVLRGETDLLVDFVATVPRSVGSRIVATASAFLVAPRPSRPKRAARLRDFDGAELIAYPAGTTHRRLQERGLADAGVVPSRVTEASTADSILALVGAGLGFSLIPHLDPGEPKRRGVLAQRVGRRGLFPIHALFRGGTEDDPAISAALDALTSGSE